MNACGYSKVLKFQLRMRFKRVTVVQRVSEKSNCYFFLLSRNGVLLFVTGSVKPSRVSFRQPDHHLLRLSANPALVLPQAISSKTLMQRSSSIARSWGMHKCSSSSSKVVEV